MTRVKREQGAEAAGPSTQPSESSPETIVEPATDSTPMDEVVVVTKVVSASELPSLDNLRSLHDTWLKVRKSEAVHLRNYVDASGWDSLFRMEHLLSRFSGLRGNELIKDALYPNFINNTLALKAGGALADYSTSIIGESNNEEDDENDAAGQNVGESGEMDQAASGKDSPSDVGDDISAAPKEQGSNEAEHDKPADEHRTTLYLAGANVQEQDEANETYESAKESSSKQQLELPAGEADEAADPNLAEEYAAEDSAIPTVEEIAGHVSKETSGDNAVDDQVEAATKRESATSHGVSTEEIRQLRANVPKFGNWENEDNVPYTVYFDKARKNKGGKMINPNNPQENPDMFPNADPSPFAPPATKSKSRTEGSTDRRAVRPVPEHRASREDSDFRQYTSPSQSVNSGQRTATESSYGGRGQRPAHSTKPSVGSEQSFDRSPLHPQYQAKVMGTGSASPAAWERNGNPVRNRPRPATRGDESPGKGAAVPRFGAWDEKNFTHIFNKVREERNTAPGNISGTPKHQSYGARGQHYNEPKQCCFPWW